MKHYKDPSTNQLYEYASDGSQDAFIQTGLVSISENEALLIRQELDAAARSVMTYSEKRILEYPPFVDYIDGVVKGDQAQIDAYIAQCLAVKAKYPKA